MTMALSCSSSCSSTVRAALLRTALAVQQRRQHAYSWSTRITSTTPAAATTATRGGEAVSAATGAASAVTAGCSTTPTQLRSMAKTTNRIGDLSPSSSSSSSKSPATATLPNAFPVESRPQKEHELHQQQQQEPSDICVQSPSPSPSSQISSSSRRYRYLWSEMTRADLEQIPNSNSIHILQDLVQQLEDDWPCSILNTKEDVSLVVLPLLDACLRMSKQHKAVAADLAERILFTCLARLPPSVADRYPNIIIVTNHHHHHATPLPPSPPPLSSDKSNNDNTCITSSSSSTSRPTSYPYPDASAYVAVMMACGNLRTLAAAERVHRLFHLMMSEYRTEVQYLLTAANNNTSSSSTTTSTRNIAIRGVQAPAPRMQTFKCLLRAYAVSGTLQGAMYAHEILNVMEDLSGLSSQYLSSRADGPLGGSSLDFLGGSSISNAISGTTTTKLIEGVSLRLETPPDLKCYTPVLAAYAKCSIQDHYHPPQILQRARILWERVLCRQEQWLKHKTSKNKVDYFQLDYFSYYPMLQIYHKYILALLQEPRNTSSPQPLRPSFSVMDDNNDNAILVEHDTLLQEIQNVVVALTQTTIPAIVPRCYRVLSPQFDDNEKHCNQSSTNITRAQREEHHPITWAYQVLVQALVLPRQPCSNYAHGMKSENELLELERIRVQQAHAIVMALAGQRVDGLDSTLFPVYRNDDVEGEGIVWPTQDIILDVILAWERLASASYKVGPGGDHVAAAATAAAAAVIPERVQQLVKVAVNAPYKSLSDFHQAIDYWRKKSQWKNAPFVNQAILERLLREQHSAKNYSEVGILIPTSQTFAMVMWSWMKSQSPQAPHKIEWLFDQLILLYERTNSDRHLPNGTHVYLLLSSWIRHCSSGARFDGKSGTQLLAAQHVTRLLQSLDMPTRGACEHAWKNQLLNERHFGIALKAWALQRIHKDDNGENDCHPDQAHEAFTLWKHLVDITNSIPPLIYCNKVLVACVKASADAQKIYLSSNGGDNDEKEKKRRQGHYKAAMHVYRHMRDHEVKNKDRKDKQRKSLSYELILQAWKQAHIVSPNQIIDDDPIQFVLELMEDCCTEGLLTQTLCFEMVEFLLLFANDDNLAKMTLRRLFGVSESAAVAILQAAPVNLVREPKQSKLLWQGTNQPTEILIENLNSAWTRNTDFGKV